MTTLTINIWDSRCENCRTGADPYAKSHEEKLGYKPGVGCGALFTTVRSDYTGMKSRVLEMRPDLEWVGYPEKGLDDAVSS